MLVACVMNSKLREYDVLVADGGGDEVFEQANVSISNLTSPD